uniref:Polymerase nucleotidyl transferase domain-containing protein n=1 Tax=Panagrolaimus sp. PS1159 TaxID=55785 RepID=A0AC35EW06_9BILA
MTSIFDMMHTESSEASNGEFFDFSSPREISLPTSTNRNSNRNVFSKKNQTRRPLFFGIPPVTPVEFIDFSKLEGYHPQAFVKPSRAVKEIMQIIEQLRETKSKDLKKFDNHIKEYYNENVQTPAVFEAKKKALEIIKSWLPKYDPDDKFFICGSTMTKLGSNDSDMDICWVIPVFTNGTSSKPTYPTSEIDGFNPFRILKNAAVLIRNFLSSTKFPFVNLRPARVPILRFTMIVDDAKVCVDLNINNITGIYNTFMLKHYEKIDKRFPMLAMAIKAWAVQAEIINPANGYLNT